MLICEYKGPKNIVSMVSINHGMKITMSVYDHQLANWEISTQYVRDEKLKELGI